MNRRVICLLLAVSLAVLCLGGCTHTQSEPSDESGEPAGNVAEQVEENESAASGDGAEGATLVNRIESRNGLHTLEHAEKIGLGSRNYELVSIDG